MKFRYIVSVFLTGCILFLVLQTTQAQTPGTPQNLSLVADTPMSVVATWTHGSSATPARYNVVVNNKTTTVGHMPPSFSPDQRYSFVATPNTRYEISVTAVGSNGALSAPTAKKPITTPSNVPSGVTVNGSQGEARVEWNYINGMESYTVYRTINNGSTWVKAWSDFPSFVSSAGTRVYAIVPAPSGRIGVAVTSTCRSISPNESAKSVTVYGDVR